MEPEKHTAPFSSEDILGSIPHDRRMNIIADAVTASGELKLRLMGYPELTLFMAQLWASVIYSDLQDPNLSIDPDEFEKAIHHWTEAQARMAREFAREMIPKPKQS